MTLRQMMSDHQQYDKLLPLIPLVHDDADRRQAFAVRHVWAKAPMIMLHVESGRLLTPGTPVFLEFNHIGSTVLVAWPIKHTEHLGNPDGKPLTPGDVRHMISSTF